MKIKILAGYTGVISTGSYENSRPSYGVEMEVEISDKLTEEQLRDTIDTNQKALQKVCYANFKADEQAQIVERIQKQRADMRFYKGYPSVTSILNWDADFWVSPEELQQYASQGSLIHAQVTEYIKTGEWKPLHEIDGTWSDLVMVKKGGLNLPLEGWNFRAFLEKYPIEKMVAGQPIISHKHKFGGTPDIVSCYYQGKKTLADVKRTPQKIKDFKQIAAYIIAAEENNESLYEQMMVIVLNDKTQQGFSKPQISTKISQYKDMFLRDRETFRKRYNI